MPQSGFNIENFMTSVASMGVFRPSKFMLYFPLPQGLLGSPRIGEFDATARQFSYWCEQAVLPEQVFQAALIHRYGYGPMSKVPVFPIFNDVPLMVRADAQGAIWSLFYEWHQLVVATDAHSSLESVNERGYSPYEIGYRDDYMTDVYLSAFSDTGDEFLRIVFRDAYPADVGMTQLSWEGSNQIGKFPLLITFQDWYSDPINPTPESNLGPIPRSQLSFTQPVENRFSTTSTRTLT